MFLSSRVRGDPSEAPTAPGAHTACGRWSLARWAAQAPARLRRCARCPSGRGVAGLAVDQPLATAFWASTSVPLWLVLSKLHGLYDRDERVLHHLTADEFPAIAAWAVTGSAGMIAVLTLSPAPIPRLSAIGLAVVIAGVAAVLVRRRRVPLALDHPPRGCARSRRGWVGARDTAQDPPLSRHAREHCRGCARGLASHPPRRARSCTCLARPERSPGRARDPHLGDDRRAADRRARRACVGRGSSSSAWCPRFAACSAPRCA